MLSILDNAPLQATILAMKRAPSTVRSAMTAAARQEVTPRWRRELESRTKSGFERLVMLRGAGASVSTNGIGVRAATSRRALRGGFVPAQDWPGIEFGARNFRARYTRRNPNGGTHTVTRTLNRQFPGRVKQGRIAFDAASQVGRAYVAASVVAIVDTLRDLTDAEGSS